MPIRSKTHRSEWITLLGYGSRPADLCTDDIFRPGHLTGADTIAFNIPGAGPHTIQPTSALPTIAGPVVIDGYTQPGASPKSLPDLSPPEGAIGPLLLATQDQGQVDPVPQLDSNVPFLRFQIGAPWSIDP